MQPISCRTGASRSSNARSLICGNFAPCRWAKHCRASAGGPFWRPIHDRLIAERGDGVRVDELTETLSATLIGWQLRLIGYSR